ncbi:hypothetical protein HCN44_001285 [Aphidius gifuensis]|uniref:Uncharacterized protein n=2 Tax=Aphidius gifuensis TaxID=684658 RepID=A0A835CLY1_APHGI|nr:hypothetical protein HCN44_001285 [Aphidius gifuensis]
MIFTPSSMSVDGKKVVIVIPKQMRRAYTPSMPKQQFNYIDFLKTKNLFNNEFITSMKNDAYQLHDGANRYQDHTSMTSGLFNSDDYFDQGHEQVNHVIPHGNGIKHAISFGKGYVPHEMLYHQSGFSSNEPLGIHQFNLESYLKNPLKKKQQDNYKFQVPQTDLILSKFHPDKNSYNNINKQLFNGFKKYTYKTDNDGKLASTNLPADRFNKNKEISTDTEFLNDYNKKLIDLTKNWPTALNLQGPTLSSSSSEFKYGKIPNIDNFKQSDLLSESGWLPGSWIQNNKGYAVTEDVEDIPLRDYPNLHIQNSFIPTRQAPQNIHLLLEQHQKLLQEIPNSYS